MLVVVDDHFHPRQGVGWDDLRDAAGVTTLHEPFGGNGVPKGGDGLAHQAVVTRRVEGDQGLDAGIADVLQLFVIGAVDVGFQRAQFGRFPGHVVDIVKVGVLGGEGAEATAADEGITGRLQPQAVYADVPARGVDELEVAAGTEDEGGEGIAIAAGQMKFVVETTEELTDGAVPVSFIPIGTEEAFGVV